MNLLQRFRSPRISRSGPIVVELVADEDGNLEVDEVTANKEKELSTRLSDAELLQEEWSMVGLSLFFDPEDKLLEEKRVVLWGHLWWERVESHQFGDEYDGGFEVEGILEP